MATRDVQKPNGIIVTPDGKTVYVADNNSHRRRTNCWRSPCNPTARSASKRVLHDFGPHGAASTA